MAKAPEFLDDAKAMLKRVGSLDDLQAGILLQFEAVLDLDWEPDTETTLNDTWSTHSGTRSAIEQRKEDIRRAFSAMKKAEQVDLCFFVDGTGSMSPWIRDVKNCITDWSQQLHRNYSYMNLRLAFVCYTDYDKPPEQRTTKLNFTSDLPTFQDFVGKIKAAGGGDAAEDVMGGLKVALRELKWRRGGTKVLIHFADAPCHGKEYHDGDIGDSYPEGDPARLNEWELMHDIKKLDIQYWFGYIHKEKTNKMIQKFNEALRAVSANLMMIEQFDACNTVSLKNAVYRAVCSSISSSVDVLKGKGKAPLRPYSIKNYIPNFTTIPEHEATLTLGATIIEVDSTHPSSPKHYYPSEKEVKFKKAQETFAEGSQRLAYHALDTSTGRQMVIKEFKREYTSRQPYDELMEIHALAQSFAVKFNSEKPREVPSLEFIELGILQLPPDVDGRVRHFTIEPFIEGPYEKFNSNGSFVAPIPCDTIQTFSHYTWDRSGGNLVVCDIQGVKSSDRFQLTDPAIHHLDFRREYGGTNLGRKGIKKFFASHCCNATCKKMRLKPFHG